MNSTRNKIFRIYSNFYRVCFNSIGISLHLFWCMRKEFAEAFGIVKYFKEINANIREYFAVIKETKYDNESHRSKHVCKKLSFAVFFFYIYIFFLSIFSRFYTTLNIWINMLGNKIKGKKSSQIFFFNYFSFACKSNYFIKGIKKSVKYFDCNFLINHARVLSWR